MNIKNGNNFTFTWKIENYSKNYFVPGKCFPSPVFSPKNFLGSQWRLEYYPLGCGNCFREYVSCYLCKEVDLKYVNETIIDFEIEIIDPSGKVLSFHRAKSELFIASYGRDDFISLEELENEMKDWTEDILTVRCSMAPSEPIINGCMASTIFKNKQISFSEITSYTFATQTNADPNLKFHSPSALRKDLKDIFVTQRHTDVQLHVGEKIYPAHKTILIARSPVFDAMLKQGFIENRTGVVEIPDVDEKTFKVFLEFLYTETVDNMDSVNVTDLLMVANKYQVQSLKEGCLSYLNSHLSEENVCAVLILADMVDDNLKSSAVDFLITHAAKILPSSEWYRLIERNIRLATDILAKLTKSLDLKNLE